MVSAARSRYLGASIAQYAMDFTNLTYGVAMSKFLRAAITGVLAACTAAAISAPMKELETYKRGLGKWSCDAKELASGKTFKAQIHLTAELDGNTYVERYVEIANPKHTGPWKAIFLMSYDPKVQKWVRSGVDNNGERNAATASGWKDDTWVWESDGANIVITQKGAKVRTFAVDVKEGSGVKRVVEASCKPA